MGVLESLDRPLRRRLLLLVVTLLLLVALTILWAFTPLREMLRPADIVNWLRQGGLMVGPIGAVLLIALASIVAMPLSVIGIVAVLAFDAGQAYAYCAVGALIGATTSYALGAYLGRDALRRLAGESVNAFSQRMGGRGLVTVIVLRLLPVAPFAVVNMLVGTTHIKLRDLLLGTLIGITPGLLFLIFFLDTVISHFGV